jgi:pimeloyl-ACP methyl ester carboxylesterase
VSVSRTVSAFENTLVPKKRQDGGEMDGDKVRYCTVSGHRLAYHRGGRGEPLLLVHGITTYSFIWRRVAPLLEKHFDVITVDLLGCGDSDMPLDVPYSLDSHADRLREFVTALPIEKFHFVGHDLGGGIGQIFAVRYPELLFDLTVINSVAYDFWPVQPITAMRAPVIRELLMGSLEWGTLKLVVKRGLFHPERMTPELLEHFSRPLKTKPGRKAFLHFARCLDNHNLTDIEEELRRLNLPVLIIRGDGDLYLSPAIAERLHREIPGSRLVRIPTAGHFIQEDEPEETAAAILDFLEGTGG